MLRYRKLLLLVSFLIVDGSLAWTAGYAIHLRSDGYRRQVEAGLTDFFELPCDVGAIRGRTFSSRTFQDVVIWLPDRRDRIFSAAKAVWSEQGPGPRPTKELDLSDGVLTLGSDRWTQGDYRQVFTSGLGHDFEHLDLTRVGLSRFGITFDRGGLTIRCGEASGTIDMTNPADGVARLDAYELNGQRIGAGVRIHARFSPKNGVDVSELILTLPRVSLQAVGLEPVLGGPVTQGQFEGSVQYLSTPQGPEIWVRGNLDDAELAELTRRMAIGPLQGRVSVNVYGARFAGRTLTHLNGRGRATDLRLSPFAPLLGQPSLRGRASLNIDAIDLALGHVRRLSLSGRIDDLSLVEWLRPWGRGSATGRLTLRINNLEVVDDEIKAADLQIAILPPSDGPGYIDRALLMSLAERALHFSWPSALPQEILPEQVEYAEFGVRLLVAENQLRVLGTHGPQGDTILTIRVFGKPIAVLKEQTRAIDLGPLLADFRRRASQYSPDQVRDWWRSRAKPRGAAPPPAPTSAPQAAAP